MQVKLAGRVYVPVVACVAILGACRAFLGETLARGPAGAYRASVGRMCVQVSCGPLRGLCGRCRGLRGETHCRALQGL